MNGDPTRIDAVVLRVRRRAVILAAAAVVAAFVAGWRAGVSLTIAAVVVIFSFLALEKLTERLGPRTAKRGLRKIWPPLAG